MGSADEIPSADAPSDTATTFNPKVSVIIPFYNRRKHIKACIDSVLASTLENLEVILVDDGSTDVRTKNVVRKIASSDQRIALVETEHGGAYEARWVGLQYANGDYIHFMDSDDLIAPGAYEELCSICDENQLDQIVFTAASFNDEKHTPSEEKVKEGFDKHYQLSNDCCEKITSGKELFHILSENRSFFVGFPMRLVRRGLIQGVEIPKCNALWHADNFYTVVWMYQSKRAMAINRKYYKRRVHRDSITMAKDSDAQHFKSILSVLISFCRFREFADYGMVPGTIESNYMMRLMRGLYKRSQKIGRDATADMVGLVSEEGSESFGEFVELCFLPLLRKAMK